MPYFRKIVHTISYGFDLVGRGALVGLMVVVIVNICLRLMRLRATGLFELISFLGAVTFVYAWAYTQIQRGHIQIQAVISKLPRRPQLIIGVLTSLLSLLMCSIIVWQSIVVGLELWQQGQMVSAVAPVPLFPVAFVMALGMLMLSLVLLVDLFDALDGAMKK